METQSDNTYNEIENTEIFLKSVSDEDDLTADEVAQFEIGRLESGQVLWWQRRIQVTRLNTRKLRQVVHDL